jgi:site-specific recombinase XerD
MRLSRAIDRFLEQMQLEDDWTARTVDSVYRALSKLADDHPEATLADFNGRDGKELVRAHLGRRYGRAAASTRATRISYFHSFFAWAEAEDLIDDDRVREIRRPPKRKPDVYRPSASEMRLTLAAATLLELAALLLMSGAGLRAHEMVKVVWRDVDLLEGRVRVRRKGHNWQWIPIDPLVVDRLRSIYRQLEPAADDHVFVAETEQWVSNEHRVRRLIDPKTPRTEKTLWRMVGRVSDRAGVHPLGPHMLRRGFANSFLRDTRDRFGTADVWTLQLLMGHSRIDTTERYLKELESDDAADVLRRLRAPDPAQASTDEATEDAPGWGTLARAGMEAAGLEPASADDAPVEPGVSEPEDPRRGAKTDPEGGHK